MADNEGTRRAMKAVIGYPPVVEIAAMRAFLLLIEAFADNFSASGCAKITCDASWR
jgi:hypothetical protein